MKSCVIPDTSDEYSEQDYARIRFHVFVLTNNDGFLLHKRQSPEVPYMESTFTTLIDYYQSFSYEYMESFMSTQFEDQFQISITDLRFHKMQLTKTPQGTFELIYHLLGRVDHPKEGDYIDTIKEIPRSQILTHIKDYPLIMWREILESKGFPFQSESQNYSSGLIIGRYQPLHLGHLYLFKKVLEITGCLKIGVGSSQMKNEPKNPFSYEERKNLIEEALKEEDIPSSRFEVYPIPDLFNFEKWMESIFNIIKDFDVIFTNNLWIGRLIQKRGKTLVYGLRYNFTKYNGTTIRHLMHTGNLEWKTLVPSSIVPFLEDWLSNK